MLDAYQGVREAAYDLTLEASPVERLVHDFAMAHASWKGTASALLTALETLAHGGGTEQAPTKAGSDVTKQKAWPKNGRVLSNALRRLAATLRAVGIAVTFDREPGGTRQRIIQLAHGTRQTPRESQTPGAHEEQTGAPDEREQGLF